MPKIKSEKTPVKKTKKSEAAPSEVRTRRARGTAPPRHIVIAAEDLSAAQKKIIAKYDAEEAALEESKANLVQICGEMVKALAPALSFVHPDTGDGYTLTLNQQKNEYYLRPKPTGRRPRPKTEAAVTKKVKVADTKKVKLPKKKEEPVPVSSSAKKSVKKGVKVEAPAKKVKKVVTPTKEASSKKPSPKLKVKGAGAKTKTSVDVEAIPSPPA